MFDIQQFIKEHNLTTVILSYYYSPEIERTVKGTQMTVVKIEKEDDKTIIVKCPDIKSLIFKGRVPQIINIKTTICDFYNLDENNVDLNLAFVRFFCHIPANKVYNMKIHDVIQLLPNGYPRIYGEINAKFDVEELKEYDFLTQEYVTKNDLLSFIQLHQDIYSTVKNGRFQFCRKVELIRKAFEIMRYDYLVCNKMMSRNPETEIMISGWMIDVKLQGYEFFDDSELLNSYSLEWYLKTKNKSRT